MMGEVECPVRLYGVLPVPQPKAGGMGVSHKTACTGDYSLIYPLDKGNEIAWGQSKNLELGR